MSKHKKKKSTIDWTNILISAIVDLIVGLILMIIDSLF